jgi:hypothetical protein
MARKLLLSLLLLAGCSKGAQADLEYIGDARSLAAEWALVNQQASQGKLTAAYVASMHSWLRRQLQADSSSLTQPAAPYAAAMQGLLKLPDGAAPDQLKAYSDKLKQQEDALESA